MHSDGFDFEVKSNQRKYKTFEILQNSNKSITKMCKDKREGRFVKVYGEMIKNLTVTELIIFS